MNTSAAAAWPEQHALEARALFERLGSCANDAYDALERGDVDVVAEALSERDQLIVGLEELMPELRAARATLASGKATRPAALERLIGDVENAARGAHAAATRLEAAVRDERTRVGRELSDVGQADAAASAYGAMTGPRHLDLVR